MNKVRHLFSFLFFLRYNVKLLNQNRWWERLNFSFISFWYSWFGIRCHIIWHNKLENMKPCINFSQKKKEKRTTQLGTCKPLQSTLRYVPFKIHDSGCSWLYCSHLIIPKIIRITWTTIIVKVYFKELDLSNYRLKIFLDTFKTKHPLNIRSLQFQIKH